MDYKPILRSKRTLDKFARTATEADCEKLLELEKAGRARPSLIERIHSRLNRMRRERERRELGVEK